MICPGCGAEDCQLEKIEQLPSRINQHGRKEYVLFATTKRIISRDPATGNWSCSKCGSTFTDKEGTNGCPQA